MTKSKQINPPRIPGWDHEIVFAEKIGRTKRCLRNWRQKRTGPAWATMGKDIYYRDTAAQQLLAATEVKPKADRSRHRASLKSRSLEIA